MKNPSEVEDAKYDEFYKFIAKAYDEPLAKVSRLVQHMSKGTKFTHGATLSELLKAVSFSFIFFTPATPHASSPLARHCRRRAISSTFERTPPSSSSRCSSSPATTRRSSAWLAWSRESRSTAEK